jgi:hypothetical protein
MTDEKPPPSQPLVPTCPWCRSKTLPQSQFFVTGYFMAVPTIIRVNRVAGAQNLP